MFVATKLKNYRRLEPAAGRRREARKRAKNLWTTGSKIARAWQPRIIATRYFNGPLNDSRITVKECARYSGLKSRSANNTGSMHFGNRRPRPWTAVESKGVSTHGRGPFSSRPSAQQIQRKRGLC